MKNKSPSITIAAAALLIMVIVVYVLLKPTPSPEAVVSQKVVGSGLYVCTGGQTIQAEYSEGDTTIVTTQEEQPVPVGSVALKLSDGRVFTLPQTISASGARYADASESTVFWNKGNGVTFTEGGQEIYRDCMSVVESDQASLPNVYGNGSKGFTLRYPNLYTVDEAYTYTNFGPTKTISGIKFTIPASIATGTNLSLDSYISVEQIQGVSICGAELFLDKSLGGQVSNISEGGVEYSFSSSTDAGAGNRYEETIYSLKGTNPCLAVRYFIHYGAIGNYPEGKVKEFDKEALLKSFDLIRRSLTVMQ